MFSGSRLPFIVLLISFWVSLRYSTFVQSVVFKAVEDVEVDAY
jgi:hypothetical protein